MKVNYNISLHNKSRCLNIIKSFLTFKIINTWIFLYFQKVLTLKLGKRPSSQQRFCFALYSTPSAPRDLTSTATTTTKKLERTKTVDLVLITTQIYISKPLNELFTKYFPYIICIFFLH